MSDKRDDYKASSFKNYDFDMFMTGGSDREISSSSSSRSKSSPSRQSQQSSRSSAPSQRSSSSGRSSAKKPASGWFSEPDDDVTDLRSSSGRSSGSGASRDLSSRSSQKRTSSGNRGRSRKSKHDVNIGSSGNGKRKKRTNKKLAMVGRIALSLTLVVTITCLLVVGVFAVYVFAFVDGTLDYDLYDLKLDYNTIMYAKDDDTGEYYELKTVHGDQNRVWVNYSDCPEVLFQSIIAAEDKRFETHGGVDWKRTVASFANLFLHFYSSEQGGSTITQQLVKNVTGDNEHSAMRKIQEIMRARYVETNYDKDVILECYVNVIHYGNGCDGIETAAQYYFGKSASELSLVECASLAATIKSPSAWNPKNNPNDNKDRRQWVLGQMLELGYITQEEYDAAYDADVKVVQNGSSSNTESKNENDATTYFEDYVIETVISGLMEEYGYTEARATEAIYSGGLKIYTTYSERVQSAIDAVYADPSNFLRKKSIEADPQSGFVVMDYSGHVLGIMGGYGEKTADRILNRATQTTRPIGSTIKPLAAYAPAVETNLATWSTIMDDSPITLANGKKWPRNSTGEYTGDIFVYSALQKSVNTIAVKLVKSLSPQVSFDYCSSRFGLTTLVASRTGENGKVITDIDLGPMGIGSLTEGAKVVEMCAAYACFGNLGYYYEPICVTKVTNRDGTSVLDFDSTARIAISEDTASVMNKMLQNVVKHGTGARGAFGGWELFGKTGTTSDTKDLWFCGGSPYYVSACWYGYDEPAKMNGLSMNPALKVWRAVMVKLHEGLSKKSFKVSSNVTYRYYCKATGLMATDNCVDCALGWYKSASLPTTCSEHPGTALPQANSGSKPFTKNEETGVSSETPVESETPEDEPIVDTGNG